MKFPSIFSSCFAYWPRTLSAVRDEAPIMRHSLAITPSPQHHLTRRMRRLL